MKSRISAKQIDNTSFYLLALIVILLVATSVRFHQLGAQSLWYDEGVAYRHSLRSITELAPLLQRNVHVPAYFGLLGFWEDLTGGTEFALRALSSFFSILSVAGTFALGKRLFHPIAGMAAAAFVALNTFSIYYAQEARMYAMLTAVAVFSMWVFVEFLRVVSDTSTQNSKTMRYLLALGLINAVGVYTHVVYALVMISQGVMAILWLASMIYDGVKADTVFNIRPTARTFLMYALANIVTIVLFAPWLSVTISQVFAQPNISDIVPLEQVLRVLQGWFAFGNTFELNMGSMGFAIYFFLLFGLILAPPLRQEKRAWWKLLLPVVWVIVSVVLYLYLELTTRYVRFLLPAQIGFALWMGRGIWMLWTLKTRQQNSVIRFVPRIAAVFSTAVLLLALANGLASLYHNPLFQRDDYRGLAQTIESEIQQGDAVIVSAAGVGEILEYYYHGSAPVYPLPTSNVDSETADSVRQIIADHERIFVVFYGTAEQDPNGVVEETLNSIAYEINDVWFGDVRLARYASPATFDDVVTVDVQFGDAISLRAYALNRETFLGGDLLQLQLEWETAETLSIRYKVFVQLLNADGVLVAQRDSEPAGGLKLTTTWETGQHIVDNHALVLPPELPEGDYTLIMGLYDIDNPSARLAVGEGDYYELAEISIHPR